MHILTTERNPILVPVEPVNNFVVKISHDEGAEVARVTEQHIFDCKQFFINVPLFPQKNNMNHFMNYYLLELAVCIMVKKLLDYPNLALLNSWR